MNKIITKKFEKQMLYDNTIILKYKIEYPEIVYSSYNYGAQMFNDYNLNKAKDLMLYSESKLFNDAKELYEYNKENGYPIMVYEIVMAYEITYNIDNLISLYTDVYIFTGGAHGNTTRESQNWDLQKALEVPLAYFYPNNPYFILDILREINFQISEMLKDNPTEFFENYCSLVLESFHPENYYITPDSLNIYFQQYDIAPYSSGIPVFSIIR